MFCLEDTGFRIRIAVYENPKAKLARAVYKFFTPEWPWCPHSALVIMDKLGDKKQFYSNNTVHSNTLACRGFKGRIEKSLFSFVEIAIRHIIHVRVSAFIRNEQGRKILLGFL